MTKRKNSRRADPRKHKKERNKAWDLLGHKQTLHVCLCRMRILCSYCNSENDIFIFSPRNKKDRGRHSSRRSFCDCYIYPGAYSIYRYRSLADDMDMYGDCPLRENIHSVVFSVTVIILLDRFSVSSPMRQVSEYPYREYGFLSLRILR